MTEAAVGGGGPPADVDRLTDAGGVVDLGLFTAVPPSQQRFIPLALLAVALRSQLGVEGLVVEPAAELNVVGGPVAIAEDLSLVELIGRLADRSAAQPFATARPEPDWPVVHCYAGDGAATPPSDGWSLTLRASERGFAFLVAETRDGGAAAGPVSPETVARAMLDAAEQARDHGDAVADLAAAAHQDEASGSTAGGGPDGSGAGDGELGSALVAPRPELDEPLVAPRDDLERRVARVWSGVLGLDRVGVHDDFFALGGHSLAAATVVRELQRALDDDFAAETVYLHPTIAAFVTAVRAGRPDRVDDPSPPAVPPSS